MTVEEKFAINKNENNLVSASEFIYKVLKSDQLYEAFYSLLGLLTAVYALIVV